MNEIDKKKEEKFNRIKAMSIKAIADILDKNEDVLNQSETLIVQGNDFNNYQRIVDLDPEKTLKNISFPETYNTSTH